MVGRRLLVTGCRGQLGKDLIGSLRGEYDVVGVDVAEFDIRDSDEVSACLKEIRPEIVLHTAAYTDVDGCEREPETAEAVNGCGTENIARGCREVGARLVYYSTDYVFDGLKQKAYLESDRPDPRTAYGRSKLAGEMAVESLLDDYVILRIAWVYGAYGKNFVRTIAGAGSRQLQSRTAGTTSTPLKVVDDQVGNPTWTVEIAAQTQVILANNLTGIIHGTSEGEVSWYGLAQKIFEHLDMRVAVVPCTTAEFPRPAARPQRSALENKRLKDGGLNVMRHWDAALEGFLEQEGENIRL